MHFVNFPHVSACAVRSIPELPKFSGEIFGNSEIFTTFAVRNAREVGKMSFVMQLRGYPPRTPYKTSWSGETPDTPCQGDPDTPSGIGFVSQICKFANSRHPRAKFEVGLKIYRYVRKRATYPFAQILPLL